MKRRSILFALTLSSILGFSLWSCSDKGLFGSGEGSGSKEFQGMITYKVDYQLPPKRQRMASLLPDQEVVYLKGGKSRLQRQLTMGVEMAVIHNPNRDSMVQLVDPKGMGKLGPTRVPIAIDTGSKNNIEYTDEKDTLTVAVGGEKKKDYVCKKAIFTRKVQEKELKMKVWYTEKLQGQPFHQFKGLKGFPLKFRSKANGYPVEKEAKKIVEKEVADTLFDLHPEGYTTRSMKELQQKMRSRGR
ncbi:MAG: hypothetical protein ABEH38_09070 [Flavobacteriales bacterium]